MYFPANPYEPVKYITYILLAVAFVSMVWNRCNERNPYTKTWYIGFIGANLIIPFILVQGVQFNLTSQSIFVDMGDIAKGYFIPLLAITAVVLLFTGAAGVLPAIQKVETLQERKMVFWCILLAALALDVLANWTLVHEDMWRYFILSRPVRGACLLYELMILCLFFTENGWQRYQMMKNVEKL